MTLEEPVILYLTLDDGPGKGTTETLDALLENNIKATFFICSFRLEDSVPNFAENKANLQRIVREGHFIGDHSYNHMSHNADPCTGYNAYQDVRNVHDMAFAALKSSAANIPKCLLLVELRRIGLILRSDVRRQNQARPGGQRLDNPTGGQRH